jgi:hypothetical protein
MREEEDPIRHTTRLIVCVVAVLGLGFSAPVAMALKGRLANATISFGQWEIEPLLARFPNNSPIAGNNHEPIPEHVRIPADGAINFFISGFHQPIIYDVGTQPGDIDVDKTTPSTGTPAGVPLIDDPTHRLYRVLDPSLQPPDRGEGVYFETPGTYLVMCGVRDHFVNDHMYGFVTVLPTPTDAP